MSPEANKAIVRRLWEDVWNRRNADVCDEIFDAAYAAHEKRFMPRMLAAFPDLRFEVEDMIAEGDKVVTRYTLIATHRGEFMGIPATGKPV
ncbi:MAG: ester cyclase, partial [Anaerolineae bacterium]|nr:ester cyclase [Anaerolineae bacterium]